MNFSPAAPAGVDDQGKANTCSLFALSKALCNGFESKKFVPGYIDFNQETVRNILMNKVQGSVWWILNFYDCQKWKIIFADHSEIQISHGFWWDKLRDSGQELWIL